MFEPLAIACALTASDIDMKMIINVGRDKRRGPAGLDRRPPGRARCQPARPGDP